MKRWANEAKPIWLQEQQITLANGDVVLWSYDSEGDILEIFFQDRPASATVELTDGVYLRFDRQQGQPSSLAVVGATALMQPGEFGLPVLTLDGLAKLPEPERGKIVAMLQSPPLSTILPTYSFKSKARTRAIPVAVLAQPIPLAA